MVWYDVSEHYLLLVLYFDIQGDIGRRRRAKFGEIDWSGGGWAKVGTVTDMQMG